MPLYDQFPYTNFHELNLDWIVQKVTNLEAAFPEGTVGISKGGTGADNSTQARENLGIIASNIPLEDGGNYMMDTAIADLENSINALADDVKYRIFRLVSDLGLTSGTATLTSCWAAMSTGDILIAPPSEFAPNQVPENAGSLIMVRNAGTSGSLRFYGNRTYEKQFSNNFPSGTWKQILNNTDIIPVNQGGTGATNAAQARQNLGIDFSGTVLSVCNIGADTAGNIPLTAPDVGIDYTLYSDVTDLGIPSGSNISAIYTVLPDHSRILFPSTQAGDAPTGKMGIIEIVKNTINNIGFIAFHGYRQTDPEYVMPFSSNTPSGTWKQITRTISYKDITTGTISVPMGISAVAVDFEVPTGWKIFNIVIQTGSTVGLRNNIVASCPNYNNPTRMILNNTGNSMESGTLTFRAYMILENTLYTP